MILFLRRRPPLLESIEFFLQSSPLFFLCSKISKAILKSLRCLKETAFFQKCYCIFPWLVGLAIITSDDYELSQLVGKDLNAK